VSFAPDDRTTLRPDAAPDSAANQRIGPYRLVRRIGRGGMGTVYLGVRDDDAFKKRVAVKVLTRGHDTEAIVQRFRNERQILASLDHQYIAGLLDGGTTPNGLPYFAMEFVEGQTIVDYCESRALDTTARLQLFRKVCSAIQYAHQNLVIHRDIKPANVLVTEDGTPKLLDFGIAKLVNPELGAHALAPTMAGMHLMTPEYASPEQVRGDVVTTATDVYSLGVLLYELLTGRRPYHLTSRAPAEIARVVCESMPERPSTAVTKVRQLTAFDDVPTGVDPASTATRPTAPSPSTRTIDADRLRRRLSGDLDNIVLKALSKEPARRYASAEQFAEDVRRHLVGLPVIAREDTLTYRAAKFVRRNRALVAAGAITLLVLVAGIVGTTWQAREARDARARAEGRFDDVRQLASALLFDVHDAIRDLPGATPARKLIVNEALEYLDKLARDSGDRTDLRRELAAAYLRVGDVQGRPLTPNIGDTAGALASYRKSAAIYEQLAAADPRRVDDAFRLDQGRAYLRLSDVLTAAGDTAVALANAQKGLALMERDRGEQSASFAARREIAAAYSRAGDLRSATGDVKGALEYRRTALARMEALAAQMPNDPDVMRQLGVGYQKLGNTLGNPNAPNVGDSAGALQQFERAAQVFTRATAAYPDNVVFRRNLAVVQSNTADALLALKRPRDALESIRAARAAFLALAASDPMNAAGQNDIAVIHSKMGEMLAANGRTREAAAEYAEAVAVHQRLAAKDPANESLQAELASDHNRLATAQVELGGRQEAMTNHNVAVEMSRALATSNPKDAELRMAYGLSLTGRGDAFALMARRGTPGASRQADLEAAERDYAAGVAVFAAVDRDVPFTGSDAETFTKAKAELARIRAALGR